MRLTAGNEVDKFVLNPQEYPIPISGVVGPNDPVEMQQAYYDTPVEFRLFSEQLQGDRAIDDAYPLAYHGNYIQHLPNVPLGMVRNNTAFPIQAGYSGRVCDFRVETATGEIEEYSLLNTAFCNGEVYAELDRWVAEQTGGYSVFKNMRSGVAIAQDNPNLPHPLAAENPELYGHLHDAQVMDVMTSRDPNRSNIYVDKKILEKNGKVTPIFDMLSERVKNLAPELAKDLESAAFEKSIDEAIAGFGLVYHDLLDLDLKRKNRQAWLEGVDIDEILLSRLPRGTSPAAKLCSLWLKHLENDFFALSVACKAALEQEANADFVKNHRNMLKKTRAEVQADNANIRKEFMQPLAMGTAKALLTTRNKYVPNGMENQTPVSPFRYKVECIDPWDIKFARLLGTRIKKGIYVEQAAEVMQMYGYLQPEVRMKITPLNPDTELERHFDLHNASSLVSAGNLLFNKDETIPMSTPGGAFPIEVAASFYKKDSPLMLDGIYGRVKVSGSEMRPPRNHYYYDLFTVPTMLRHFHESGVFGNASQGMPGKDSRVPGAPVQHAASIADQLTSGTTDNRSELYAKSVANLIGRCTLEMQPLYALVQWRQDTDETGKRGFEVVGSLENGDALEIIGNSNHTNVRINPAKVIRSAAARKARARAIGRKHAKQMGLIGRGSAKQDASPFVIAGPTLRSNEHILGKIGILGNTVHIGVGPDGLHALKVVVMRSEGRVSSEDIAASLDDKLENYDD